MSSVIRRTQAILRWRFLSLRSIEVHPLFGSGEGPPESVMDFTLWDISVDEAMRLNSEWHSVLPDTVKSNLVRNKRTAFYGLEYDGRYYATAIWTDPVAANRLAFEAIELRRLAIADDAPKNTATRMLSLMRKDLKKKFPEIQRAISYQSVDHHHGTIYKADNWMPANRARFVDWTTTTRKRAKAQINSDKIRWERQL